MRSSRLTVVWLLLLQNLWTSRALDHLLLALLPPALVLRLIRRIVRRKPLPIHRRKRNREEIVLDLQIWADNESFLQQ